MQQAQYVTRAELSHMQEQLNSMSEEAVEVVLDFLAPELKCARKQDNIDIELEGCSVNKTYFLHVKKNYILA